MDFISFFQMLIKCNFFNNDPAWPSLVALLIPSWSWSYRSWIYNYLCNLCLSQFEFRSWRGTLDSTLCAKVCQGHAADRWFSPGIPVSSASKTVRHDITEILLKVALSTMTLYFPLRHLFTLYLCIIYCMFQISMLH